MDPIVFRTKQNNFGAKSTDVAAFFEKRHNNVMRRARKIMANQVAIAQEEKGMLKSEQTPQTAILHIGTALDQQGKPQELCYMNRAGFVLLVMSFTGKKAQKFKEQYIAKFDEMEAALLSLRSAPELNLQDHTRRDIQIANSKHINHLQYAKGGVNGVVQYNRKNCVLHTGKRPTLIKSEAKANGLPAKQRTSAKEVLRNIEPETACCMSLADEFVQRGATLDEAAAVSIQAKQVFAGMMRLGFKPAQLSR